MFKRKGQSTLEYVIILTAIVAAIIAGAALLAPHVTTSMDSVSDKMEDKVTSMELGTAAVPAVPAVAAAAPAAP